MIVVTCPHCLSQFRVKPEPGRGTSFVKCASCAHVFVVTPDEMSKPSEGSHVKTAEFLPELTFVEPPPTAAEPFTAVQTSPVAEIPDAAKKKGRQAVLVTGPHDEVVPLSRFQTTFGRRNADVLVDDPDVSRQHAVVERYDEKYLLKDLESTNGTYVNGQRVTVTFLEEGDVIRMGKSVYRFHVR
jgi:predicted Zn finger-like uncharacterized protein